MKNRRRRKTSREGRKTMTPTAEEKRKSIHTRKTREFSRMRIAYLRQTSFNGKIAFLYVRVPTHFVYFCVLCVLARARAFFKKVWRFAWKSFLFFFSPQFSSKFENDQTHQKLTSGKLHHLMTSFFFDEHQEKMMSWEPMRMGACMWLFEKWMMDDSRPSSYITSLVFTIIYI